MASKLALVTGASKGIGAAIALALAEKKIKIILGYKSNRELAVNIQEKINREKIQKIALNLLIFNKYFIEKIKMKYRKTVS